ncbi:MAG: hypothetical protein BJ554DRAFT_8302 [Olpidium bornovanus]|uniref:Uncharacterized protein n=1 Tax=Olpidium bornovanus TaxID=278681 RepID=A0A8H7ZUV4_9FUNG|nr:MAG: hypothetical protein BJ554DRAFT_8302 [Olpidium bornovanus]
MLPGQSSDPRGSQRFLTGPPGLFHPAAFRRALPRPTVLNVLSPDHDGAHLHLLVSVLGDDICAAGLEGLCQVVAGEKHSRPACEEAICRDGQCPSPTDARRNGRRERGNARGAAVCEARRGGKIGVRTGNVTRLSSKTSVAVVLSLL